MIFNPILAGGSKGTEIEFVSVANETRDVIYFTILGMEQELSAGINHVPFPGYQLSDLLNNMTIRQKAPADLLFSINGSELEITSNFVDTSHTIKDSDGNTLVTTSGESFALPGKLVTISCELSDTDPIYTETDHYLVPYHWNYRAGEVMFFMPDDNVILTLKGDIVIEPDIEL